SLLLLIGRFSNPIIKPSTSNLPTCQPANLQPTNLQPTNLPTCQPSTYQPSTN
ncbi:MAG: hypothetical protein F6K56_39710, partial [Moorea sp. SIO3G5]|nr:hypothetical protein [Moorena sp. SIO3G5]